jgi:hypothetical protein
MKTVHNLRNGVRRTYRVELSGHLRVYFHQQGAKPVQFTAHISVWTTKKTSNDQYFLLDVGAHCSVSK